MNTRRIYVLAADGLYLLFRDGTPGVGPVAGVPVSNIQLAARSLLGIPAPQGDVIERVDVTNTGNAPALPVVSGLLSGFGPELDPGAWLVGAADADCTTPVNYCSDADQCQGLLLLITFGACLDW